MIKETVLELVGSYGYYALFVSLILGIVGLPIPDEVLMTYCGYLVSTGALDYGVTLASAIGGSVTGITISYWLGLRFGLPLIGRYGKRFGVTPERLERVNQWYDRFGKIVLMVGYFIPGVRHVTALTAGIGKMRYRQFAFWAYLGAVIWSFTFITLGKMLGVHWTRVTSMTHDMMFWVITGIALLAVAYGVHFLYKRRKRT